MGFGRKVDLATSRTLDLDSTYRNIIKPAVEAAGLQCFRADELVHSGRIDVPVYELLLNADVVVADLSTSSANVFYELGVRHALRPYTTIIVADDELKAFPFDINHAVIRQYHYTGMGVDFDEAVRFREQLTAAIVEVYSQIPRHSDSPVYTFLNDLVPPMKSAAMAGIAEAVAKATPVADYVVEQDRATTHSELMQQVDDAQQAGDFATAKLLLKHVRQRMRTPNTPDDPYIIQRLALVTYKAKHRSAEEQIQALNEARALLTELSPATSKDTETLGLWGAVHIRLWDITKDAHALDEAVRAYERGFNIRNDYYNGINFAFLLNVRAAHAYSRAKTSADDREVTMYRAEAIADFVQAQRVRREVIYICDDWLGSNPIPDEKASDAWKSEYLVNKYWVMATKAEALLGIGLLTDAERVYAEAESLAPESWMKYSTMEQRKKLESLLADSPLASL
jgi:tetratricopeptide (TPR) repeat protein